MGNSQARPLSILHVTAPAPVGGLESVVRALSIGQTERGCDVEVITVLDPRDAPRHDFVEAIRQGGIRVRELRLRPRAYREERDRVREILRDVQPDVVHTHGYRSDVVAGGVARRMGVPVVSTVHGFTGGRPKNRVYERLQRWTLRRHDGVVAVSRPLVESLEKSGVPSDRLFCVQNAWHPTEPLFSSHAARKALGIPVTERVLGWVGRFAPEKGADVLLRTAARLTDLNLTFSLVGDGPEATPLRELATELGVEGRVRWHGRLPSAGRFLRAFDVYALTSRMEGTPMVLFEAMEAEVPIVATLVGGVGDVLSDDEAVLVPCPDPVAVEEGVRKLCQDPEGAARRATRARERLHADFRSDIWIDRYERVYRTVLERRAASPNSLRIAGEGAR